MPTYQYSCTECGHFFEQFQTFSEDSLTVCPQCQGRLRKVFNAVGVVFKGSGFYRTDSRTDSRSGSEKGDGGSTSQPAEKSPAATGDSKPTTGSGTSTSTGAATPSTPAASGSSTSAA